MKKAIMACVMTLALAQLSLAVVAKPGSPVNLRIINSATGIVTSFYWTVPEARVNGAPIAIVDIAKYTLYWGTVSGEYTQTMDFAGNVNEYYNASGHWPGPARYYFAITSTDTQGRESGFSNELTLN